MVDLTGHQLGQYTILSRLGEGGMASIYRARQLSVDRDVAIKVIESTLARNEEFVRRFEREARTVAMLDHPHILKIFDFGQDNDLLYLVMELKGGGNLATLIRSGTLTLPKIRELLDQVSGALDYAHRKGIVHRDLKPQNILLDETDNAVLTDFGIARIITAEATPLTQSGMVIGTPAYMAPEQWRGGNVDARSDLYALGIVLYEMISGQLPFKADTPAELMYAHLQDPPQSIRTLRPDVSDAVEAVLSQALAKDQKARFQSGKALSDAFARAIYDVFPENIEADAIALRTPTSIPQPVGSVATVKLPSTVSARNKRIRLVTFCVLGAITLLAILLVSRSQNPVTVDFPVSNTVARTLENTTVALQSIPTYTTTPESTIAAQITATRAPSLTQRPSETLNPDLLTLTEQAVKIASLANLMTGEARRKTAAALTATSQQIAATKQANQETQDAAEKAIVALSNTDTPTLTPSATPTPTLLDPTPLRTVRTDALGIKQVLVSTGCFLMGSTDQQVSAAFAQSVKDYPGEALKSWFTPELPQHKVCLTNAYWIDQTEITNAMFDAFINAGGYTTNGFWSVEGLAWKQTNNIRGPIAFSGFTLPLQPRIGVSWYEAEAYANWRTLTANDGLVYRLPTEAEWEYAARGPNSSVYPWGDSFDASRVVYKENSNGTTELVGSKLGGASWVGAFDLSGNVSQWVQDWMGETYYQNSPQENPAGPNNGQRRSQRGGSWNLAQNYLRAAYRVGELPSNRDNHTGFRLVGVRSPAPATATPTPLLSANPIATVPISGSTATIPVRTRVPTIIAPTSTPMSRTVTPEPPINTAQPNPIGTVKSILTATLPIKLP